MSPKKKLYDPKSKEAYKLSRTRIDNFIKCPRCFYVEERFGIKQPGGLPFTLNSAVDHLLKKEFDGYRVKKEPHPLMKEYKIDAVPYPHKDMDKWRNNFVGIKALHKKTNFLVSGAIDDVWQDKQNELLIVDYKSTSKKGELSLNESWHESWKRQMEIYQWLFRQNEFKVANIGYFVYCNGQKEKEAFNNKLEFNIEIHSYTGKDDWIEKILVDAKKCLDNNKTPDYTTDCDFCNYQQSTKKI